MAIDYCPVCGAGVDSSMSLHRCNEKRLKRIEAGYLAAQSDGARFADHRTYGGRLDEAEQLTAGNEC